MPERLIDAEAFEKHIMGSKVFSQYFKELVQSLIWGENTVDAVRVVHGHWDYTEEDGYELYECSVCGKKSYEYSADYPYCPMCGAKMDEEEEQRGVAEQINLQRLGSLL